MIIRPELFLAGLAVCLRHAVRAAAAGCFCAAAVPALAFRGHFDGARASTVQQHCENNRDGR